MTRTTDKIPLLDLKSQYQSLKGELLQAIHDVMDSGQYIMGASVDKFEKTIAAYCGTKHAIGVANGTDALLITLDALGVGLGDEVITSPFTFFASAEVISQVGATPVFIDIEPDTYNIDVTQLQAAITSRTKAIIPVHIFGQPADLAEIMTIAKQHQLHVIEDACQAIGARYQGQKVGSWGNAGTFSFFPTKNLGGYGDGGMIITNDDELAKKLKILRVHGSYQKYYHSMIGYNSRLDSLQAAMLQVKFAYIDEWNERRRQLSVQYNEAFQDLPIQPPLVKAGRESVFHLYIIQTEHRDQLSQYLEEKGISTGVYYPVPLHRQVVYHDLGYREGSLPVSERASQRTMALPLYPEMTSDMQQYIIEQVRKFFRERGEA